MLGYSLLKTFILHQAQLPTELPMISWVEKNQTYCAHWRSAKGASVPKKVMVADDTLNANEAYKLACEGTAILWRGDFNNGRQLLQAMARRCSHVPKRKQRKASAEPLTPSQIFHLHRQAQSQRARVLSMLLIPLNADATIPLRRAPDVQEACIEVYGKIHQECIIALTELQGLIGAHEWRKKGVYIAELDAQIHPYYGVFSPVRGEYLALVNAAPLTNQSLAFDIGTGTGVLSALLAKRGVNKIIATDIDSQALACAHENLSKLGYAAQVELLQTDMFPSGKAPLIVCNPPWLPVRANTPIEHAIYDDNSQMLRAFLNGLKEHLTANGEGWLIMSDFAEHLGLRSADVLEGWIAEAGLSVLAKTSIKPKHPKTQDESDPLHHARAAEMTHLFRLALAN